MIRSVLVLVLLAGCAAWSKPGGTPEALKADQAACDEQARRDFPPTLGAPASAGVGTAPPVLSCAPNRGCVPTGGSYLPPPSAVDENAAARDQDFAQCMGQRGWSR